MYSFQWLSNIHCVYVPQLSYPFICWWASRLQETQMYRTDFWTLWEKTRVGWSERTASKHVYYQGWNRSPVQVGSMRQVLRPGALGRPRGMGWGGRRKGVSGWGTHVNPWLIHVNVWQKPLQYCKVISLQLIKKIKKKKCLKPFCTHTTILSFPLLVEDSISCMRYSIVYYKICFVLDAFAQQ